MKQTIELSRMDLVTIEVDRQYVHINFTSEYNTVTQSFNPPELSKLIGMLRKSRKEVEAYLESKA